jgi:hypothetical protein
MEYLQQSEASELVKAVLSSGAIKLHGLSDAAEAGDEAARKDAAYVLAFYNALLTPSDVAATSKVVEAPPEPAQTAPGQQPGEAASPSGALPAESVQQPSNVAPPASQEPLAPAADDYRQYIPESARKYASEQK